MDTQTVRSADDLPGQIREIEPLNRSESAKAEQERHISKSAADALRELGCFHGSNTVEINVCGTTNREGSNEE